MKAFATLFLALAASSASAADADPTAAALAQCLDDPGKASTAGQTECETTATHAYDVRVNRAYAALAKRLPADASRTLRQAQRTWLAFREAEGLARTAIYATRQGTMFVPMEAASSMVTTRDRALQLEAYQRVVAIEPLIVQASD